MIENYKSQFENKNTDSTFIIWHITKQMYTTRFVSMLYLALINPILYPITILQNCIAKTNKKVMMEIQLTVGLRVVNVKFNYAVGDLITAMLTHMNRQFDILM